MIGGRMTTHKHNDVGAFGMCILLRISKPTTNAIPSLQAGKPAHSDHLILHPQRWKDRWTPPTLLINWCTYTKPAICYTTYVHRYIRTPYVATHWSIALQAKPVLSSVYHTQVMPCT